MENCHASFKLTVNPTLEVGFSESVCLRVSFKAPSLRMIWFYELCDMEVESSKTAPKWKHGLPENWKMSHFPQGPLLFIPLYKDGGGGGGWVICPKKESSTWNSSWYLNLPSFFWMLWAPYLMTSPSCNYLFFCLEAPWRKTPCSVKPVSITNSSRLP